jgi:hypothetical protein
VVSVFVAWGGFVIWVFAGVSCVFLEFSSVGCAFFCVLLWRVFAVHNTFQGIVLVVGFLVWFVRWVAGWLCWLPQVAVVQFAAAGNMTAVV